MHLAAVVQLYSLTETKCCYGAHGLSLSLSLSLRMWKRHMWKSLLLKSADRISRSLDFHQCRSESHIWHNI